MMQHFMKPNFMCGMSNNIDASRFDDFQRLWNHWALNTFEQISIKKKRKNQLVQFER